MKTLGPGVRCYIGWSPHHVGEETRCHTGTIDCGPLPIGSMFRLSDGRIGKTSNVSWIVRVDGKGPAICAEALIFPLDDGDGPGEEERTELSRRSPDMSDQKSTRNAEIYSIATLQDKSASQIGEQYGISAPRVSQIVHQIAREKYGRRMPLDELRKIEKGNAETDPA